MHLCYTLAVLLRTIFNTRNVVLNLERSNTFVGYGTVQQFWGPGLCPLVPSLLNITQFLDEVPGHEHTEKEWLLAYARVLQRVAEVSRGCKWVNTCLHPMVCTADLIKAFMMATEVQHEVRDIVRC